MRITAHPTAINMPHRIAALFLCFILAAVFILPVTVQAQAPEKTVRVGWYDSSYNNTSPSGRRSGYAYEYQIKLAAYTGWTYEYVSGSWPDLLQMLKDGKIDLMSDVSYTPERAEMMLYPSTPMGTEDYYLFIAPGNTEITLSDYSSLDGKRIGVNKDSIQAEFFADWAEQKHVHAETVEVTCSEDESLRMLETGILDAYITVDSFVNPERAVPVFKVGSSDYYFAVSRNRPELLSELDTALERIMAENPYYNQRMFEKYIKRAGANAFLSADEIEWLSSHGPIRVGYQDNYLAFCAKDPETGELTGAMKDYLAYAADCFENAHIDFEAIAFPTAASAIEAVKSGEVDCMFPANFTGYDCETMGVLMTAALMDTELYAVVRQNARSILSSNDHVIVAVNEGNPNYESILQDYFPSWREVHFPTTADCLKAVSSGLADCVLISNFRYNNIARLCERYKLTTLATGVQMDYCLALQKGDTVLYSILAKTVGMVPHSAVSATLSHYITEDARLSFSDFIVDHLNVAMAVTGLVLLVIVFLLIQNMRAVRTAKRLISATETDDLTGLYNRNFFFQYANRRYHAHPDTPKDAIVLNIDQFHSVNALNGRDFGDQVLRVLGNEIRAVSEEHGGIAGRFEADRFDIYCRHTGEYTAIFERLQKKLDGLSPTANIRLRMGVMPWQPKLEPVQQFDRARTACSMARGHYKEHLIIFDEAVREREVFEQRLLSDLRRALDTFEFDVFYQPKYDIQSEPPKLVSAEALVRWNHPELGMISPDDFIPLLEKNGQINLLDRYVWNEVARQILRWRDRYGVTLPVSVNLSRVDVFDPALEKTLDGILQAFRLDHEVLKLEVTESAYTENADHLIQVVESLRKKGYQVEMDDFGTGYSSLNMLSAMPIDVLKMDRAFIRNIEHNEKDVQLVALILGIARNLKIPVVAEGVETEKQMLLLKELGCPLVQGYYFSRPLYAGDFEQLCFCGRKGEDA